MNFYWDHYYLLNWIAAADMSITLLPLLCDPMCRKVTNYQDFSIANIPLESCVFAPGVSGIYISHQKVEYARHVSPYTWQGEDNNNNHSEKRREKKKHDSEIWLFRNALVCLAFELKWVCKIQSNSTNITYWE